MEEKKIRMIGIAKGIVQGVFCRAKMKEAADAAGVLGYAENLEDGTVEVVAEGTEEKIDEFIDKIRALDYPVEVREFETTYGKATGEFKSFSVK
ncbi:Acylphosphatase [Candidatus Gugararchaeum adminiculabundum]|nr:Acylphosphatase [Candidatus Gugararchaeum adminiculabundum]